jgi:hypothetical protein
MARSDQVYRFSVGNDGGARSAVYRLWAQHPSKSKGDLYIGTRLLGEDFKVSLHSERGTLPPRGHFAISESTRQEVALESRFLVQWARNDAATLKGTSEFEILVPTSELHAESPPDEDTAGIHWLAPAPVNGGVLIKVLNLGPMPNADAAALGVSSESLLNIFQLGTGAAYAVTKSVLSRLPTEFVTRLVETKSRMLVRKPKIELGSVDYSDPHGRAILGGAGPNGELAAFVEVYLAGGVGRKRPNTT